MTLSICQLHRDCIVIHDPYSTLRCPMCKLVVELNAIEKCLNDIEEDSGQANAAKKNAEYRKDHIVGKNQKK